MATIIPCELNFKKPIYDHKKNKLVFGLYGKIDRCEFFDCRVSFHHDFNKYECNDFVIKSEKLEQKLDIISELEQELRLSEENTLKFYNVNSEKNIYFVNLPKFWHDPVRFTFLSCFIYDCESSLQNTIKSEKTKYLCKTIEANHYFISGNYYWKDDHLYKGWVRTFRGIINIENYLDCKKQQSDKIQLRHDPVFPIQFVARSPY